ncbi:putative [NiFe]-hydrogenase large subunit [Methanocella paludicola SANAE]|uniref:[NiFe]-hydrogenase large subunit n=1 Tax=Methanocella paludicola (strain DSM 17711 / JCM 13418 / NBRC 101707 / SANAE) TaxID=304371 RepID=D1Z1Z0_METPS|nr:NADH-quinone oxidoreductase subunit C [Methanocella paludicola]BAI62712.1 putative [NiFe]-hydrogenase large subunit [Methanocella paludicola SANAE]
MNIVEIRPDAISDNVTELLKRGARLIYASGVDMGVRGIKVNYYFCFDMKEPSEHTILRTYLDRENPVVQSITPITDQADWSERELIEFLGVKVQGHPNPTHLWLPLNWDDMYLNGRPEADHETERINAAPPATTPRDNIVTLPVTAIPYGPYHPAFIESNFLKMSVEDEVVKKVDLKLGFNHRSVIKLMERRDYYKDIFLAERICGFCNSHHALSFARSVEDIASIDIPPKAKLARTLLCEMERIQSHLLAVGLIGDLTGFRTMLMHSLRVREEMQDSLEVVSGQRVTHGLITIGGIRRDITPAQADFILNKLRIMKKSVPEFFDQALSNDVLVGRLENVGVLSLENSVKLGAVGPTARGSGLRIDVRKNSPYEAYEDVDWDIVTENGGDSLARMKVKMREVLMSMHIAEQCCEKIKTAPAGLATKVNELPCGEAISKSEPPRGELLYHVASNGTNTPDFVRIRVPTFLTAHIMLRLIQGGWVGDVPAIIGSIDPCFSCTDRVAIIKNNEKSVVDMRTLVDHKRTPGGRQ